MKLEKGSSAFGIVITDTKGVLIIMEGGKLGVMDSPLEAELEALAKAVYLVEKRGESRVLFVSDCKGVITATIKRESWMNRAGITLKNIEETIRKHNN